MMASIDTTNATGSRSANLVGSIDEQATMAMMYQVNKDEYKLFDSNFFFVSKATTFFELNRQT